MISLLAGNSRILLTINENGGWEQLYYPYPGLHQQVRRVRLGLRDEADGRLMWLDDDGNEPNQEYLQDTNVCRCTYERAGLQVTVDDAVHPDRDLIIRRIAVRNPGTTTRRINLFHYQSMQLAGSRYRETAYWDPERGGLHHYKRSYHMQFVGRPRFDGFTCGEHTLKGLDGSYADADDGVLMGNVVSHGSADSIGQWNLEVPPGGSEEVSLFILIGRTREEVHELYDSIDGRQSDMYINETVGYWNRWADERRASPDYDLSPAALALYRRSLFVLRNCSAENGSIIASPDGRSLREGGDGYEYCWWRDGSYISQAMCSVGILQGIRSFLQFARQCQEPDGSFLHRHFPDGKIGPTWHPPQRIQVDQTASVIQTVQHLYQSTGDVEELLGHWELVRDAADFLMGFVEHGLPKQSYDLWEERFITGTYATGMVAQALEAAASIAKALGRRHNFWAAAASSMRALALETMWNDDTGCFVRSLIPRDDTIDASVLLVDLLPPGDPRQLQLADSVEKALWQDGVGGVARYTGDTYFGHENPWIICTLWLARARLRLGDLDRCLELIEWVAERSSGVDLLPEQADAATGERRGAIPLVWSHSTYLELVNEFTAARRRAPAAIRPMEATA